MNKKLILSTIVILCFSISFAQKKEKKDKCDCPNTELEIGDSTEFFELSNGKKIILCGTIDESGQPKKYSEFILSVCGKTSIIDFWNATKICKISVDKDTLHIKQLVDLPTGVNQKLQNEIWSREKIYFDGEKVMRVFALNKLLKTYKPTEINAVNKAYLLSKKAPMDEKKLQLAAKLFIATISGNATSREFLLDFKDKYKVEGGEYEDQYKEILAKLELWDKQ
jgi:hypothetical protein